MINLTGKEAFNQVLKNEFQLSNFESWLKSATQEKFVFKQSPDIICVQVPVFTEKNFDTKTMHEKQLLIWFF